MTKSTITRERVVALIAEHSYDSALVDALEHLLAAMDSVPVGKKVACWSCQNEVEIAAIADCDGCCPKCGTRIHLDEEPYVAPQPAPVVLVTDAMAYAFHHALTDSPLGDDDVEDIKAGLRAALVNGFNSQPAPVVPEEITSASAPELFEIAAEAERLGLGGTYAPYAVGWNACRAAMLNGGNS
ncbi:hypothetical protein [Klebsiella variicola]|uniref:hypothetical protein n=1 Tax=Klebsiella variicola TaxID=244366 RepID=UPI003AF9612C